MNKKIIKLSGILLLVMSLSACAPKVSNTKMLMSLKQNPSFKGVIFEIQGTDDVALNPDFQPSADAIKRIFSDEAKRNSDLGLSLSGSPKIRVAVLINQFRFVSVGARIGGGVAVGEAIMGGIITLSDAESEKTLGAYEFLEKSGTSGGMFTEKTANQEEILVHKIITLLKKLKS